MPAGMASVHAVSATAENTSQPPRKKFKTSELPLNHTQRAVIDGLLHTLKKKGEFDSVRKQAWSMFEGVSFDRQYSNGTFRLLFLQ